MSTTAIKILLVDDHHIVRQGMKQLLESSGQVAIVGEAANGEEAVLQALSLKPDIILMDVNLPKVSGYEASRSILGAWPDARILVLTNEDDSQTIKKFSDLHIKGFLLKDIQLSDLLTAIKTAAGGENVALTEELSEKLSEAQKAKSKDYTHFSLTEREQEILKALTKGYSNQQLAEQFTVSPKTIHNHLYSIYSKIGVSSRTEAMVWAIESDFLK